MAFYGINAFFLHQGLPSRTSFFLANVKSHVNGGTDQCQWNHLPWHLSCTSGARGGWAYGSARELCHLDKTGTPLHQERGMMVGKATNKVHPRDFHSCHCKVPCTCVLGLYRRFGDLWTLLLLILIAWVPIPLTYSHHIKWWKTEYFPPGSDTRDVLGGP